MTSNRRVPKTGGTTGTNGYQVRGVSVALLRQHHHIPADLGKVMVEAQALAQHQALNPEPEPFPVRDLRVARFAGKDGMTGDPYPAGTIIAKDPEHGWVVAAPHEVEWFTVNDYRETLQDTTVSDDDHITMFRAARIEAGEAAEAWSAFVQAGADPADPRLANWITGTITVNRPYPAGGYFPANSTELNELEHVAEWAASGGHIDRWRAYRKEGVPADVNSIIKLDQAGVEPYEIRGFTTVAEHTGRFGTTEEMIEAKQAGLSGLDVYNFWCARVEPTIPAMTEAKNSGVPSDAYLSYFRAKVLSPQVMHRLGFAGLRSEDVNAYRQHGWSDPEDMIVFATCQVTPQSAGRWKDSGLDASTVVQLEEVGLSPADYRTWLSGGVSDVQEMRRAAQLGVHPADLDSWRKKGAGSLREAVSLAEQGTLPVEGVRRRRSVQARNLTGSTIKGPMPWADLSRC